MAYGLACSLGSQIAAVGIMSGIMLPGPCDTAHFTPVIHFHGTADDALPYAGNQDFRSVADVISFWVNHNQISPTEPTTTQFNGGRKIRFLHGRSRGQRRDALHHSRRRTRLVWRQHR